MFVTRLLCRPVQSVRLSNSFGIPIHTPVQPRRYFSIDEKPPAPLNDKPPQNSTDYAIWHVTQQLLHRIEDRLPKYRDYNSLKILGFGLTGALLLTYIFQKQIKGFFSQHGAEVASQSLSSSNVQNSAGDLSKAVLQQVLEDPKTSDVAVQFLANLVRRPDTQQMLTTLVVTTLQDDSMKKQISELARDQVAWYLLHDQQTLENFVSLITRTILRDETLSSSNELVKKVLQDAYVQDQVAQMLSKVVVTDFMKQGAVELGTQTLHQVLDDENIKEHTTTFVRAVLQDQAIQHDAGYALWEALKVSVTPRWFARETEAPPSEEGTTSNTVTS